MSGFGFSSGTAGEIDLKRRAMVSRVEALVAAHLPDFALWIMPSVANDLFSGEIGRTEGFRVINEPLPVFTIGDRVWLYPRTTYGMEATITAGPIPGIDTNSAYYRARDIEGDERVVLAGRLAAFDENHNQKRAYRQGKTIQCRHKVWGTDWRDCVPRDVGLPIWSTAAEYRVKPDVNAETKAAFAAGKRIEARVKPGRYDPTTVHRWHYVEKPIWADDVEYRVQPEKAVTAAPYVKRVDEFADLKAAIDDGKVIQIHMTLGWVDQSWRKPGPHNGFSEPRSKYRIKPVNPYAHLQAAWARGEKLEVNFGREGWRLWLSPTEPGYTQPADEYRVKTKPVATHVLHAMDLTSLDKVVRAWIDVERTDGKVTNVTVKEFS